jgi:hypothetical protein
VTSFLDGSFSNSKKVSSLEFPVFFRISAHFFGSNSLYSNPKVARILWTSLPRLGATSTPRSSRFILDFMGSMYFASCRAASFVAVFLLISIMTSFPFLSSPYMSTKPGATFFSQLMGLKPSSSSSGLSRMARCMSSSEA